MGENFINRYKADDVDADGNQLAIEISLLDFG